MPAHLTSYRPSVHGFRFANRFRPQTLGPVSTRGWSSGMAQVSLDFFHAGRPAPAIDIVDFGVRPASGVGAASWSADRVDLFVRCDNDVLATQRLDGGRFSDWRDLAFGASSGAPAAASRGLGHLDIVVRAPDGRFWHQRHDGDWAYAAGACRPMPGHWIEIGGGFDSSAAVASAAARQVDAYARDADGCLWFAYSDGPWHEWESLGRPDGVVLLGDPAAVAHPGWRLVLALGSDDAVWQREWFGGTWRPWRSLGGSPAGAPALASPSPGRIEAYTCGADGTMSLNVFTLGRWQGWKSLGAPPPGLSGERPAAVSHDGLMDVYALAGDRAVWHKRWRNGWQPWQSTESAPGLTSHTLTAAIHRRQLAGTATAGRIAELHAYADGALFELSSTGEMVKLARILRTGDPVSAGLLSPSAAHEVVVYGGRIEPGGVSELRVYDPGYPRCDRMAIVVDPAGRSITSSTGERWRSLWVRDDIGSEPPPI